MADTAVDTSVFSAVDEMNGLWGPYWSDDSIGVIVYSDVNEDLSVRRTVDAGASWSKTVLQAGRARAGIAVWYDKETPGNSGTLLHIAWLDFAGADARYVTYDVATASLGTIRTVDSTVTVSATMNLNRIAITQTRNSNIIIAFSTQTEIECYKSSDNFATAGTAIADVFETTTEEDWVLLFPANTGDDADACALFGDRSVETISLKMYDDSVDSWTETSMAVMVDHPTFVNMDGTVRLSDSHLLVVAHSAREGVGNDLLTWDLTVNSITSPTITTRTNVFTDQTQSAQTAIFLDQNTDDVYIAHLKGGIWTATVDAVFHISTDDMSTWGSEQVYSEAAADDLRLVSAGRTVGADGGRYQPVFFNDDLLDIFVNLVNDIEFTSPITGLPSPRLLVGVGV